MDIQVSFLKIKDAFNFPIWDDRMEPANGDKFFGIGDLAYHLN